jgi:two-component system sensor histidine kinase RegB
MRDPTLALFKSRRSNWVRLRTLIFLRWIAIAGQLAAITVAQRLYNLDLELGLCFLAIGAAITANLIAVFVYPENKRLTESEVAVMLLFDISQLSFLLYLTGGLHNPFALLILVPVTIGHRAEARDNRRARRHRDLLHHGGHAGLRAVADGRGSVHADSR